MDRIRAAGPLSNHSFNAVNASSANSAGAASLRDGFVITSQDTATTQLDAMRQLAQARGNAASIATSSPPSSAQTAPNSEQTRVAIDSPQSSQATPEAHPAPAGTPSESPVSSGTPTPSGDPAPSNSPAPSGTPAPSGDSAPSNSPVPLGTPAPSGAPTPANSNSEVDAPDLAEAGENLTSAINIGADTICELGTRTGLSAVAGAIVGAVGAAIGSIGYGLVGAFLVRDGIREHDTEKVVGGAGNLFDCVSNGAVIADVATKGAKVGSLGAKVGTIARHLAPGFGIASSAVDLGFGIKDIHDGIKERDSLTIAAGALGVAFGVATAACWVGGGLPALVVSGAALIGKCSVALAKLHHARHSRPSPEPAPAPNSVPQRDTRPSDAMLPTSGSGNRAP